MLITLYNPTGEGGHGGGGTAAPVSGQILSEVLEYMGVERNESENEEGDGYFKEVRWED